MTRKHPGRPRAAGPWPTCKVENCLKTTERGALGLCATHYMAARRGEFDSVTGSRLRDPLRVVSYGPGARCSVEGCQNRPKANGFCTAHWQRTQNGLDLSAPIGPPRGRTPNTMVCVVQGCGQRANNKGMCLRHAEQRRHGILDDQGNRLRENLPGGRPRTKDRWVQADGYILVQAPEGHPFARQDGSILEHRLVMEQVLGHYLDPDEFLVHHKDGDRGNNHPDNLEVLSASAKKGEGHPPGSEISKALAIQVLLQQPDLPIDLRDWLQWYKTQ